MAKKQSKPRPMKSRKNGLKHARRIKQNQEVIKKIEEGLKTGVKG
jgi:hypothetical protein